MATAILSVPTLVADTTVTLLPSVSIGVLREMNAAVNHQSVTLFVAPAEACAMVLIRDVWKVQTP